jgi:hypothetical protein
MLLTTFTHAIMLSLILVRDSSNSSSPMKRVAHDAGNMTCPVGRGLCWHDFWRDHRFEQYFGGSGEYKTDSPFASHIIAQR